MKCIKLKSRVTGKRIKLCKTPTLHKYRWPKRKNNYINILT